MTSGTLIFLNGQPSHARNTWLQLNQYEPLDQ